MTEFHLTSDNLWICFTNVAFGNAELFS